MKIVLTAFGVAIVLVASPAVANHIFTPSAFDTRGECESENARLSNDDAERQFPLRPDLFSSLGEARSFMTRAFTCEYDADEDAWFLTDHRREIIASDWFKRRQ